MPDEQQTIRRYQAALVNVLSKPDDPRLREVYDLRWKDLLVTYGMPRPLGEPAVEVHSCAGIEILIECLSAFGIALRGYETALLNLNQRMVLLIEANRKLAEADESTRRSNVKLQTFLMSAAHDLHAPLRQIISFGQLVETRAGALPLPAAEALKRMRSAAARMDKLLDGLLELSRLELEGKLPTQAVDLRSTLQEVLSDLEVAIAESDAVVTLGELGVVQAHPVQMRLLLQNLLSNALKFSRPGVAPRVTVTSSAREGHVELRVTDNGIGFEAEFLERIFKPFERLNPATLFEGSGVGLAICRAIVELHGGRITAQSAPGRGSTFIVTLPSAEAGGSGVPTA